MKALLWAAELGGGGSALNTFIFHRVLSARDELFPGEVTATEFDSLCGWIAQWFNVLPLDEAVQRLGAGSLPPRAACVTFDDGYADNHSVAMPILRQHGLNATFFVATGFLDGGRMWNDTIVEAIRRTTRSSFELRALQIDGVDSIPVETLSQRRQGIARLLGALKYLPPQQRHAAVEYVADHAQCTLPGDLMMTSGQVRDLHRAGMRIGGHTVNHPILARLGATQSLHEIGTGREVLQGIVGEPVTLFAYPNGKPREDYLPRDVELVKSAGFKAAVSTAWGAARRGVDTYQLPRFTPWDRSRGRFALRLARNLLSPLPSTISGDQGEMT